MRGEIEGGVTLDSPLSRSEGGREGARDETAMEIDAAWDDVT